jgi:hypothetical protein
MAENSRRRFLKSSAGVVSGLALGSCADEQEAEPAASGGLDRAVLDALSRIVLPRTALGEDGITRVVAEFLAWLDDFEPVAERDHPYDSGEILYGPPHPAPLWQSQLEALTLEAEKRFGVPYVDIDQSRQWEIFERQLPGHIPVEMPYAGAATHVAIGLIAWFYATPEANDLALDAKVGRETCRGLASGATRPEPLEA